MTVIDSAECTDIGAAYSSKSTPSTPSGGSCFVSGGLADKSAPAWTETALVCGGAAAPTSCTGGVCAPVAAAPFRGPSCVHREGDVTCPDGFPDKTVLYRGVVDSRSCSGCACSTPAGASCQGALVIYSNDACTPGGTYALPMDNQCHNFDYTTAAKFDPVAKGGSCTPSGGAPTGAVENVEPVTVCCAR